MSSAALHSGSKFLALLLDSALRSLLLACFLAGVLAMFRVRAVRARMFVWHSLLAIAIVMPALMLLSPAVPVPVPSFSRTAGAAPIRELQPPPAAASNDEQEFARSQDARRFPNRGESAAPLSKLNLPQAPLPGFLLPAPAFTISWLSVALCLYFAVASVFFARILIGAYFTRRLRKGAQIIDDSGAIDLGSAASRANGLRRMPRLAESELLAVPVTLGISRPAVLLPCSWRDWSTDELAAVLAHEVSHVARHDSLVQLLALLHRAVFWFSPLSWWLDRYLVDLAEQASDEAALVGGIDRRRYAQALLGFLANLEASPARVWWHGVAMAKTGEGEERVERILAWRSVNSVSRSLVVALVAICVPAAALSVAAHPAAYRPQQAPAPAVPAPPPPPRVASPDSIPAQPLAPAPVLLVPGDAPPAPPQVAQPPAPPVPPQEAVTVPAPQLPQAPPPPAVPPTPPAPAPPVVSEPPDANFYSGPMNGVYWPWGPRFVIVTRGSDRLIMSGSDEDAEHARSLRSNISGDFIWFEHDGRTYIIRDQAIVDRAKQIWAQRTDSSKQQRELQAKERELSKEMREQVRQRMQDIRVKIPDMSAELQKLQSEIKNLNASGATMRQLGDLQRELGELQQALGEARWNSNLNEINRRAGELGRQMGEIGRQIGELARQNAEQARQSSRQMRELFDNAIAGGKATPE
ncbi:MAG: M48 family metalloprotease [Acidobacteriota bacterium]|nr:M48 family metalloprotease [Acidobacteriota bacterium]